ncbi:protein translocase subunit SecF [Pseudoalteromonas sp. McH1-7]|uniref:protein translocase subunit SecF n=1 Tax=Pseudoalteromonas TaxID=53246 RepID=UPI0015927F1A|nr:MULTISPECIES: protein translocase subunit SecF [Pseudoalteromonas]MDW7548593.1 protein translocase subunit SecF [Pseudoalteromonas peptidolytica]NUZ10135.1 protein translocase subunit SecF [Pseudoalteromonas sp. McH1-7]
MKSNTQHIRLIGLILGMVLVFASLVTIAQKGIAFGQDFTGGYVTVIDVPKSVTVDEMQLKLHQLGVESARIDLQMDGSWRIFQIPSSTNDLKVKEWISELNSQWHVTVLDASYLGAQVGDELIEQGGLAGLFALLSVLLYLACRFEWRLAVSASIALFHDVVITLGLFSATQVEFDLTVLAALLAIIGYSLNDSIVVGDRVRELLFEERYKQAPVAKVIDQAIKDSLSRTLITSLTTLATVLSIWWLAGAGLSSFAMALCCGIAVGTLSSLAISATLPQFMGLSYNNYRKEESEATKKQLAEP